MANSVWYVKISYRYQGRDCVDTQALESTDSAVAQDLAEQLFRDSHMPEVEIVSVETSLLYL